MVGIDVGSVVGVGSEVGTGVGGGLGVSVGMGVVISGSASLGGSDGVTAGCWTQPERIIRGTKTRRIRLVSNIIIVLISTNRVIGPG